MDLAPHADRLARATARAYEALDDEPSRDLLGLVELAADVTGCAAAVLYVRSGDGLVPRSAHGFSGAEPPPAALDPAAPDEPGLLLLDELPADRPAAEQAEGAPPRVVATAALRAPSGGLIGTLTVLDPALRRLSAEMLGALSVLAQQAAAVVHAERSALEVRAAVVELDRLAHVDPLTGLLNRAAAGRALTRVCAAGGWGVLFIDVDNFKAINDLSGHAAGDVALQVIARRLSRGLRPLDLLARWAGDEFVALLAGPVDDAGVATVIERLRRAVSEPYVLDTSDAGLSVSIGGLVAAPGSDPDEILQAADRAMYAQKRERDSQPASAPRQVGSAGVPHQRSPAGAKP